MCVDADSLPPISPVSGAAVDTQRISMTAADGATVSAFVADGGDGSGVVVLPDVRGLFTFYEELAVRFAEHGHRAIVIDYFARNDPPAPSDRADFEWRPHVMQTTLDTITADTAAAVEWLGADRTFAVGFCFGGSNVWHQAAWGHGLAGVAGFYGHPDRPGFPPGAPAVLDRIGDIECPVMALMGGSDPGIPVSEAHRFEKALDEAGIPNEVVVYPNAPHSFFDRKYSEFPEESQDAWQRLLQFVA